MLTLAQAVTRLKEEGLLFHIATQKTWHYRLDQPSLTYQHMTYDSRDVKEETLFICKGLSFKPEYLQQAIDQGATTYVATCTYDVDIPGIIVTDIHKAMAVLAQLFYDHPEKQLRIVGITGTKGKTTTTYFAKDCLSVHTMQKVAQFSSVDNILDGQHPVESALTTPESLDLYRMMREAVDNGMTHLVMEVSSQAYKLQRVYQLHFDVGIFLNISSDHISDVEHPTFDDYFYCKTMLLDNSDYIILNKNAAYVNFLEELLQDKKVPYLTYGDCSTEADYTWESQGEQNFCIYDKANHALGSFHIALPAIFNQSNATAAILASMHFGATVEECQQAIANTHVPGRMEMLTGKTGKRVLVDYAHNYLSLSNAMSYIHETYPEAKVIVVTGSTGGKAVSRREDIGKALSEQADVAILASEDSYYEDPTQILSDIEAYIDHQRVEVHQIIDRTEAIEQAIRMADDQDVILLAGKGRERYMCIGNQHVPYEGDDVIAMRCLGL